MGLLVTLSIFQIVNGFHWLAIILRRYLRAIKLLDQIVSELIGWVALVILFEQQGALESFLLHLLFKDNAEFRMMDVCPAA